MPRSQPTRAIHRIPGAKRAIRAVRLRVGWTPWLIITRTPDPPPCPPGWSTGPPDFVGVGAQKAGTSWWDALVRSHPEVHRSDRLPKELHFFNRFWERPFGEEDVDAYHALFPRPEGRIVGEWTPRYMSDFWTMPLLRKAAPEAKILVVLRDPIDRYMSAITQSLSRLLAPRHPVVPGEAMARGLYFAQLSTVLASFPRDQILVLQYERCLARPESELARTYSFLGVDPSFTPAGLDRRVNPTRFKPPAVPEQTEKALIAAYREDVAQLVARFPEIDLQLWPRFSELAVADMPPRPAA